MAYPESLKAELRADYETGNFSVAKLNKKYSIAVDTIKLWIKENGWQKGKLKPKIEESVQNEFIKHFTKIGFDRKKVTQIIQEMGKADKTVIIPSGAEGQSGFAEQIPDWQARDKAITQYAKLTGSYAAEKVDNTHTLTPPAQLEVIIKHAVG